MRSPSDKQPKLTIFYKLVGTLLFITIPIYVISLVMNQRAADIVRNEISNSMEQKTDYALNSIETEIERIVGLQRAFINDPDLNDLSIRSQSLNDYEKTKAFNDLSYKIAMLASSSKFIKEAFVIMPNINKRLSSMSAVELMDENEYEALKMVSESPLHSVYVDGRLLLPIGFPNTTRTQFVLVIELSMIDLGREVHFFQSYPNSATYLVDHYNQQTLYKNVPGIDLESIINPYMSKQQRLIIEGSPYLIFQKTSDLLQWGLMMILPENDVLYPVYSFQKWYWYLTLFAIIIVFASSYMIYRLIHTPLKKMVSAFKKVELGSLEVTIERKENDEFQYLYMQFNKTVRHLKQLIQQVYEKTIYSQQAELKQLQSQINPHFFYNSLYILYMMAHAEDTEGTKKLSKYLGDYFKFITYNKSDMVDLALELEHAKTYASIQQLRFGSRISCEFIVEGDLSAWVVPRLIIQPILENAFVHGLENTESDGEVSVKLACDSAQLTVSITDNGRGMQAGQLEELNTGLSSNRAEGDIHGIYNVHRRLRLLYGSGCGVRLTGNDTGGVTVTMHLSKAASPGLIEGG
ncbi:sensor histidine kinase [Paenibacillus eucommiae]|uniref:Two-component system sensor histidine kinase YesM n=1 Tax=Paenibacillus eucommiae TaxID=1355755 RepID=A0ABS4J3S1_9BACL|nr:sensor histidine kinase [Paenibacillus eucommiae]MBP1993746.1 two-component system sensor histidine kinase YesM [Paenibacillus eucommiae]